MGGGQRTEQAPSASRVVLCPPLSFPPSLCAGAGLNQLASPPSLPCWWEGCQAQPVCPPWRPCQVALPRPHEELAAACQPVSHLERAPAAAQTFQRGQADANPAHGLGNQAAGNPVVRKLHSVSLPCGHFRSCLTLGGLRCTLSGPEPGLQGPRGRE